MGDPNDGLPVGLLRSLPSAAVRTDETLFDHLRRRAYDEYTAVRHSDDPEVRHRHMLIGNAWLALSEQSVVQPAVAVAFRANLRALGTPWNAIVRTQREWTARPVSRAQHRREVAMIERVVMPMLDFQAPPGVLDGGGPNSDGKIKIVEWYAEQRRRADVVARFRDLGEPFSSFELPDACDFWPSLRQRLGVILLVMMIAHDGDWYRNDHPTRIVRPPAWAAFERHARAARERLNGVG